MAGIYWLRTSSGAGEGPPLAGVAPPPPRDDSIAVLPFVDLGGEANSELIVEGVFDDLITDLSKLSELTVLAANSVNGYRGRDIAPLAVANDLAVRYVLEGSVRRIAEDLRINVRLIDSREGKNAWAQSYEGPVTDVFKFQDNMVENIVSSLAIKVSEAERGRVLARETASVPAYEAFRRGQAALLLKTPENLPVALAAFREAITVDPALQPGLCRHGAGLLERLGLGLGLEPQRDRGHHARHRAAISRAGAGAADRDRLSARLRHQSLRPEIRRFARFRAACGRVRAERPGEPHGDGRDADLWRPAGRGDPVGRGGQPARPRRLEAAAALQCLGARHGLLRRGHVPGGDRPLRGCAGPEPARLRSGRAARRRHWHSPKPPPATRPASEHRAKAKAALDAYLKGTPDATIEQVKLYWPFRDIEDEERLTAPLRALGVPEAPSG